MKSSEIPDLRFPGAGMQVHIRTFLTKVPHKWEIGGVGHNVPTVEPQRWDFFPM